MSGSVFLLVHGGWHGGWCWRRVADRLRALGHRVFTPTLTGMGEREHLFTPEVGLHTHVQDVLAVLRFEQLSDVVLVGHSYGGAIITQVADRDPAVLRALVYVDAIIPEHDQPGWDGFPPERQQAMQRGAQTLGGVRVPPPDPAIWGITDPDDLAWARACVTPHPIRTMFDAPVVTGRWQEVPRKHYVLAGAHQGPRFVAHHAAVSNQPGWTTAVIDGGHDLMVTHPEALTHELLAAAVA
ncbi:MAG: alpha/beta hydrolase [Rhodoferax sp.]|nr:alpha/beta hydrolase [Rhodoferax sp.]